MNAVLRGKVLIFRKNNKNISYQQLNNMPESSTTERKNSAPKEQIAKNKLRAEMNEKKALYI